MMLLIVASSFNEIVLLNTTKTCGTFYKVGTSRYVDYYYYKYNVDGELYTGSIPKKQLKIIVLDELKELECVEIEYSNYLHSRSKVTDDKVLRK